MKKLIILLLFFKMSISSYAQQKIDTFSMKLLTDTGTIKKMAVASPYFKVYRYEVAAHCEPNLSYSNVFPISTPEGMHPSAAWVGDFSGGDFAEVQFTIQELNPNSYRLWAVNVTDKPRTPKGRLSIIIMYENN